MAGRIKSKRVAIVRTLAAATVLCALGGISAADAADSRQPTVASAFADLGTPADVAVPAGAVDLAAITPATSDTDSEALADPMPGGMASWYGAELAGHRTASGDRFDPSEL